MVRSISEMYKIVDYPRFTEESLKWVEYFFEEEGFDAIPGFGHNDDFNIFSIPFVEQIKLFFYYHSLESPHLFFCSLCKDLDAELPQYKNGICEICGRRAPVFSKQDIILLNDIAYESYIVLMYKRKLVAEFFHDFFYVYIEKMTGRYSPAESTKSILNCEILDSTLRVEYDIGFMTKSIILPTAEKTSFDLNKTNPTDPLFISKGDGMDKLIRLKLQYKNADNSTFKEIVGQLNNNQKFKDAKNENVIEIKNRIFDIDDK